MRKFGREIRKGNPEKKIQMRYIALSRRHNLVVCRDVFMPAEMTSYWWTERCTSTARSRARWCSTDPGGPGTRLALAASGPVWRA